MLKIYNRGVNGKGVFYQCPVGWCENDSKGALGLNEMFVWSGMICFGLWVYSMYNM